MILETQMLIPTEKLKLEKMVFDYIFVHVHGLGACVTSLWCSLKVWISVWRYLHPFLLSLKTQWDETFGKYIIWQLFSFI